MESTILVLHINSGLLALIAGFSVAIITKGSTRHQRLGTVFVLTMLGMGTTAFLLGMLHASPADIAGGLLVCYLVATAWAAVPGRRTGIGPLDHLALLFSSGLFSWASVRIR